MLAVVMTIVMFVVLIFGLVKNWHAATWMFLVCLVFGTTWVAVTGQPLMAESASGNAFVDVFELITQAANEQFAFVIFLIGVVMGYVAYVDKINGSAVFAHYASAPLKKIKSRYLVVCIGFLISVVFKFVIPAPDSVIALLIATIYPIMRAAGCSRASCASAMAMGVAVPTGPANPFIYVGFQAAGLESSFVPEWVFSYQLPMLAPVLVAMMVVLFFVSKFFDKRENAFSGDMRERPALADIEGTPRIYGILPLLPLVAILLGIFVFRLTLGLAAITFMCLIAAVIIRVATAKEKLSFKEMLEEVQVVFTEAGSYLGGIGFLLIACGMFATVIQGMGGVDVMLGAAASAGMPPVVTMLVALVIVVVMVALTGATVGLLPLFAPVFMTLAQQMGADPYAIIGLLLVCCSLSGSMSLIYTSNIIVAGKADVAVTTLCKRNVLPPAAAFVVAGIYTVALFVL